MLRQTVPRSEPPQQLGIVRIELKMISRHTLTDICDAAFETISYRRSVVTTAVQIHLRVHVHVLSHCASGLQLRGPPCIQRTVADRAPSPVEQNTQCRLRTTYSHCTRRGMFCQIGTIEALLARCHAAQTGVQAGVAAVMEDSVEGCCEVEQTDSRHLTTVCSNQQIAEHLRLSAVEPVICMQTAF